MSKIKADEITTEEILQELFKKPSTKSNKIYDHFRIEKPNYMHQVDILYLSYDDEDENGKKISFPKTAKSKEDRDKFKFKYALTLVDVASRYKQSRALKNKDGESVFNALKDIYEKDKYLKLPKILNSDLGPEFKNKYFTEWSEKNDVTIKYNNKGFHLSFVENMNMNLARKLYRIQNKEEIETGKVNRKWVEYLEPTIKEMNNTITSMIKMKPIDAVKLDKVKQPQRVHTKKDTEMKYEKGTKVRRVLNNDEVLNLDNLTIEIKRRRITDPYWSFVIYSVVDVEKHCENCLWYHRIKDESTGEIFPHMYTYYQLQETKIEF